MLAIGTHIAEYISHTYSVVCGLHVCVCVQKEEEVVNYMVLGMISLHTVAELIMNKTCIDDTFCKNKLCSIPKLVTYIRIYTALILELNQTYINH